MIRPMQRLQSIFLKALIIFNQPTEGMGIGWNLSYLHLFLLTNNLNMADPRQSFPQNSPYMQPPPSRQPHPTSNPNLQSNSQESNSHILMARIQDLERNLSELTALLAEDSGLQDAYAQLQQENEELRGMLAVHKEGGESEVEAANELLKDNLLKQNEEMEDLYRELQEARNSQSRLQERGHSEQLESKVQELNDEVSNLLGKIHELVDENNAQQESLAQLQRLQESLGQAEGRSKDLQVENNILKEEIASLEEHYIQQMARLKEELEEKSMQRTQSRPGQIRGNTDRGDDRMDLQQEITALRAQLATRSEEDIENRQSEAQVRRKWEERLTASEAEVCSLNEEVGKLRTRLRQQDDKCSEYQFILDQQLKDRERLAFYKNSYADSETLRNSITRLEAEKEELQLKTERLKAEISQRKFEPLPPLPLPAERNEVFTFMQGQAEEQLDKCKRLNKQLKASIGRYEADYRQLRKQYEQLLQEKVRAVETITANQSELQRHKAIYEQVVARCNATTSDYRELEKKLMALEGERTAKASHTNYDKENAQLVQLENSSLRQEIAALKEQLAQKHAFIQVNADGQAKRREREILQELELYRQKYLKQLQKGKQSQQQQGRISDLQNKLSRVNKLLNDKLKELEYFQARQGELLEELDKTYTRCKMEFESFGVRHHPETKRLQSELLAAQRQIMESEFAFKTQIASCEDELRATRLENQHHRAKIEQLLLEVNRERNSLDYSKLARSLELSELTQKQLKRELDHKDNLLEEMRGQLKQMQNRERAKLEASLAHKDSHLQQEKENLQMRIRQQEMTLQSLAECLNSLQPASRGQETLKRAIRYLSKLTAGGTKGSFNEDRRDSVSSRQSENSRYEQLVRKKSRVAQHFKQTQQFLIEQPLPKIQKKEEKGGILRRLQQNWAA